MLGDLGQGAKAMATPTNTQGVGAAAVKARKSGLSTEDQLAQDAFVQKFVSRGANALNTAIQQGLVDVNSSDLGSAGSAAGAAAGAPASQPAAGKTTASGAAGGSATPGAAAPAGQAGVAGGAAPAAGAAGGAAPAGQAGAAAAPGAAKAAGGKAPGDQAVPTGSKQAAAKPQVDVNVDKIVSGMRKLQPTGNKPLPPTSKAAQTLAADIPKVGLNKDYLINTGSQILKLNNAGYDVSNFHKQWMGQYAKGNKQKTISEDRLQEIYKKLSTQERFRRSLKRAGYDPDEAARRIRDLIKKQQAESEKYRDVYKDLGIDLDKYKVDVDEAGIGQAVGNAVNKVKGFFGGKKAAPAAAPAQGAPAAAPAAGKPSMGAWLRDNFMKGFLRGIDLGTAQQQIDDILKRMPQSLKAKTVNKDLTDIANIAWAVSDQGRKQDTQP